MMGCGWGVEMGDQFPIDKGKRNGSNVQGRTRDIEAYLYRANGLLKASNRVGVALLDHPAHLYYMPFNMGKDHGSAFAEAIWKNPSGRSY